MPWSASPRRLSLRTAAEEPLVRAEGVSKVFRRGTGTVHALRDVSLTLPAGSATAIVGRSGSGKSTLLHLLAAMDRPTSGTLEVGGWALGALSRREQARYRREMVGMIFQGFNLVPSMTALENVMLPLVLGGAPRGARRDRARACLERVGLGPRLEHRPSELSGGEQQRVAIARALAADPPLLLADEPTGNLDSTTGRAVVELLGALVASSGKTLVLVTHHPDEVAAVAGRFVELHDGTIV